MAAMALCTVLLIVLAATTPTSTPAGPIPSAQPAGDATAAPFTVPAVVGRRSTFSLPGAAPSTSTKALALHGGTLFVGTYDDADPSKSVGPSTVAVVDAATGTVQGSITTSRGLLGLVASPDGRRLYATASVDDVVDVIDVASRRVVTRIPTGDNPEGIAISPDGRRIYVSSYGSGTVTVLDTITDQPRATMQVGTNPAALAISPDGRRLAVGIQGSVALLDTSTLIGPSIDVGSESNSPLAAAFASDGRRLFVDSSQAGADENTVAVIDPTRATPLSQIAAPAMPVSMTAGRDGVYVGLRAAGSASDGSVLAVSSDGAQTRGGTRVGDDPASLALSGDQRLLYAVDGGATVSVVRVR